MAISSLQIADFRNLSAVEIAPRHHGLNIFYGNNGSGKTGLLEAIHYLGLGRSFRSSTANCMVRHTTDKFSLYAQLVSEGERHIPLGVERHINGQTRLRMAEQDVASITEVASFLPLRLINTHSHHLFESGPIYRRKYLDWGLFYQFDSFLPCWRQFERVIKQRNVILRENRPKRELDGWTEELVKHGLVLDGLRRDYVQTIIPLIIEMAEELLGLSNLTIEYLPGWKSGMDYATALANHYPEEYRSGYTQHGPHRADLDMTIEGVQVKHILSRGQQKLLVCAMILAQGMSLATYANKKLIYLIDDLPAEMDLHSRNKLITLLSKQQTQVFITAIDNDTISCGLPMNVFHVEHGSVNLRSN
jgi:DNA replication and repair protein RecF